MLNSNWFHPDLLTIANARLHTCATFQTSGKPHHTHTHLIHYANPFLRAKLGSIRHRLPQPIPTHSAHRFTNATLTNAPNGKWFLHLKRATEHAERHRCATPLSSTSQNHAHKHPMQNAQHYSCAMRCTSTSRRKQLPPRNVNAARPLLATAALMMQPSTSWSTSPPTRTGSVQHSLTGMKILIGLKSSERRSTIVLLSKQQRALTVKSLKQAH